MPTDFTAQITAASSVIDHWLAYKRTMERLPGLSVGLVYKDKLLFRKLMGTRTLNNNDQPAQSPAIASLRAQRSLPPSQFSNWPSRENFISMTARNNIFPGSPPSMMNARRGLLFASY